MVNVGVDEEAVSSNVYLESSPALHGMLCRLSFNLMDVKTGDEVRSIGSVIERICDAAVRVVRRLISNMPSDNIFVKLDFSNSFN